jgi:hypothetical protein
VNTALTLSTLPKLLPDCVLVGHAKRADVIWTPRQWFEMCIHMMNDNPSNFFLMPYRDDDGTPRFKKAFRADVEKRMGWAWDTITGTAKPERPGSIGFYPTNAQRQSRWAAMDFDMHDHDDQMRARDFAHKAFACLIREPQLFVALTSSAGDPQHSGWHLFIFTADFYPCEEWTRLLKQVADQIGAPVKPGICEIFPDDSRGIGRGIRAPGTWNPKNGECGLILRETVTKLLPNGQPAALPKEKLCSLGTRSTPRGKTSSLPSSEVFKITAASTRHSKLLRLVGVSFPQCGKEVARKQAELQHTEASPAPVASLTEHLAEFEDAWAGMERQWKRKLSPGEREKHDSLTTETEREAFRIIRNWSQTDSGDSDLYVHCRTLGERLGITLQGAADIRRRFCSSGILRKTAEYEPHKKAARYEWIASHEPKRKQSALSMSG